MLTQALATVFARVAAANVVREFPRRLDQLVLAADAEWRPRQLHPAFYGSYDWHSAVHMHWVLARLLRVYPGLSERRPVESVLDAHLSVPAMERELAFFHRPGAGTFERPYGWAWLLELQAELIRLGRWHDAVAPLARELALRLVHFLKASRYPVRAGTHGNTAFACVLALDYARTSGEQALTAAIEDAARRWYLGDRDYPVDYEPSGDDFLSPALAEALLMHRVLPAREFSDWEQRFWPDELGPLAVPPTVPDHADPKHSHLDGLCLSRAWCFAHLGKKEEAARHLAAGMPHVAGGDYAGEHWLASFALLAVSAPTLETP